MAHLPSLSCLALSFAVAACSLALPARAQSTPTSSPAPGPALSEGSGAGDFDFELGRWQTRLRRRVKPLSGSKTWAEYAGTTTVRKVWDGAANLVELDVKGDAGRIVGLSLRLYNPESRQWSLNFASRAGGALTPPVFGAFKDGVGEFYGQDTWNGRVILVRFVISVRSPTRCHFEQAFSEDGGKTWEVNWIATDTLIPAGGKANP